MRWRGSPECDERDGSQNEREADDVRRAETLSCDQRAECERDDGVHERVAGRESRASVAHDPTKCAVGEDRTEEDQVDECCGRSQ
jgi:hypothetical protein